MGLWAVRSCQNLIKAKIAAIHCLSPYFKWYVLGRSKLDANLFTFQFLPRSLFAYLRRIFQRLHLSWWLRDPLTLLSLVFYCPFLSPDLFQAPGTPASPHRASVITADKPEISLCQARKLSQLKMRAYLIPLWLVLFLLWSFVLGINDVNHLITAIGMTEEKKKKH